MTYSLISSGDPRGPHKLISTVLHSKQDLPFLSHDDPECLPIATLIVEKIEKI